MGLIPAHAWLHAVVAVAGAVICLYSFTARFWKGTVLLSEVMAATAIGVIIGPAVAGIVDPQTVFSSETLFYVVEEVRSLLLLSVLQV
jgi:NhaP-type Na+/H+ or K+/H+ antiporter